MKKHLITFYNTAHEGIFKPGAEKLQETFHIGGFDTFTAYTEKNSGFTQVQFEFFNSFEKGFGFWAWKPLVILNKLSQINEGDVVVYNDSGRSFYNYEFKTSIDPLINNVVENYGGIGVALSHWYHREYTKQECFDVMQCTGDLFYNSHQAIATWNVWQKSALTLKFLKEWTFWCFHPSKIITDQGAEKENQIQGYQGHRHDQSILTNLILKYSRDYSSIEPIHQNKPFWEKNINFWI